MTTRRYPFPASVIIHSPDRRWTTNAITPTATTQTYPQRPTTSNSTESLQQLNWSSLFLLVIILWGILGNSLVCLSILTDRKLQNATNHFLFSLAVADLLVSICVMPFGLINELNNGIWTFGYEICIIYICGDVFFCSVSIVHMSVISFDRYWGISRPFKARSGSKTVLFLKITACWTITILVACPVIFLAVLDPENVYRSPACQIFVPEFQIYGSMVTFFIPFLLMAFAYIATVRLLRQQEALYQRKSAEAAKNSEEGALRRTKSVKRSKRTTRPSRPSNPQVSPYRPLVRRSTSLTLRAMRRPESEPSMASSAISSDASPSTISRCSDNASNLTRIAIKANLSKLQRFITSRKRSQSEMTVRSEQKATKVLGIVFVAFFICWAPFFATNVTLASCGRECEHFPIWLITTFLWLGYSSSTINPIIYTIFNKTFRRSFRNILQCRIWTCHQGSALCTTSKSTISSINGLSFRATGSPSLPARSARTPLRSAVEPRSEVSNYGSCYRNLAVTDQGHVGTSPTRQYHNRYRQIKHQSLETQASFRQLEPSATLMSQSVPSNTECDMTVQNLSTTPI